MTTTRLWSAVWLLSLLIGCQPRIAPFDREAAEAEILALHRQQQAFHFDKDAAAFASQLSERYISVNEGEIDQPGREESLARISEYFERTTFEAWEDLSPPIVRFSDDGSLAYTLVNKEVIAHFSDEQGRQVKERTVFAWVAIYKKYGDTWKIDCVASTHQPSQVR